MMKNILNNLTKLDVVLIFLILLASLAFILNIFIPSDFALETFKTSFAIILTMVGLSDKVVK